MRIAIPSRSRSHMIGKLLTTLKAPCISAGVKIDVFVPESQISSYHKVLSRTGGGVVALWGVPDDVRIARKRRLIALHYTRLNQPEFLFVDDDINFLMRKGDDNWQLDGMSTDQLSDLLLRMQRLLQSGHWSHVALSPREGNNRSGTGPWNVVAEECNRAMRVVGWRTKDLLSLPYNRAEGREDLDWTLSSLRAGRPNLILYYYAQGQTGTNVDGGCADWRTVEISDQSAKNLAELHPGLVRLTQKHNKTGGLADRTEVVISWKQAYKSSGAVLRTKEQLAELLSLY